MVSVEIITNIASHYRKPIWLELFNLSDYEVRFVFGVEKNSSIRQLDFYEDIDISKFQDRVQLVKNVKAFDILIWQVGVITHVLKSKGQIFVLLGDFYVLSSWIISLLLKAQGKKIIFWGHGIYGNEGLLKGFFRKAFLKLGHVNLVYNERAVFLMKKAGFDPKCIVPIYNSLNYRFSKVVRDSLVDNSFFSSGKFFQNSRHPVLVFIGRLTKVKKIDVLLNSVLELRLKGFHFNTIIIGEGPERTRLQEIAAKTKLPAYFLGACYDEFLIGKILSNSDLCVSPGNVGLTCIHALSYGLPVCTHNEFANQRPEAEAIVNEATGIFFDRNKGAQGLSLAIERWFELDLDRESVRQKCYEIIDQHYNPIYQKTVFERVFKMLYDY